MMIKLNGAAHSVCHSFHPKMMSLELHCILGNLSLSIATEISLLQLRFH